MMRSSIKMLPPEQIRERIVLNLEVLTPVHIGGREGMLTPLDFVFHQNRTHILDEDRLAAFLYQNGTIDAFLESIRSGQSGIKEFLTQECSRLPLKSILPQITKYFVNGGKEKVQFRQFIRDGNGQIYLPGSSIKGVLRTAFLKSLLDQNPSQLNRIEEKVKSSIKEVKKNRDKVQLSKKWLNQDILQQFSLPRSKDTRPGPNRDIFRCLTVRDAYPVGAVKSEIIKIKFLSKSKSKSLSWSKNKKTGKPLEIWIEAVTQGSFRTEIIFDRAVFSLFDHTASTLEIDTTLSNFLERGFSMSTSLIEHERDYLRGTNEIGEAHKAGGSLAAWYEKEKKDLLRIGFGSGMLGTSIGLLFSENTRQQVRNKCGHDREDAPAPKTRRIYQKDAESWLPLGWLKVVKPEDNYVYSIRDKKDEPVRESWENATISWKPNEITLYAESGKLKAFIKGKEVKQMKEMVPDPLRKKLFEKRKPVSAIVEVESEGNAFKIIQIK